MAQIMSQDDQRRPQRFTDQHGRKWFACIEKESGHPCTPVQPIFQAPVIPDQKYIELGDGEDKDMPGRVFINYTAWIDELDEADREWLRKCHETGSELYKDAFDPEAPFNIAILNRVGARPHIKKAITPLRAQPVPGAASLPVHACQQGNAWALGKVGPKGELPKMPAILKDFFTPKAKPTPKFETEFEDTVEEPKAKKGNAEALARYREEQKAKKKPVAVGVDDDEWANAKE